MEEKILKILIQVKYRKLTPKDAQKQVLGLFSVSGSAYVEESDFTCPKCGSHKIDVGAPQLRRIRLEINTCLDCGEKFE